MKKPLLVGITGGIGAGKSIICRIFSVLGTPIYDADSRAKWLMNHSDELGQKIVSLLGKESFKNGQLDRAWIATQVFNDADRLAALNALIHPEVEKDFHEWVKANETNPYLIKEAALLFETQSYKKLGKTILVVAPKDVRSKRIKIRDHHRTPKDIEAIMAKQMQDEDKIPLATTVLVNDGTTLLIPQILKLHEQFSQA